MVAPMLALWFPTPKSDMPRLHNGLLDLHLSSQVLYGGKCDRQLIISASLIWCNCMTDRFPTCVSLVQLRRLVACIRA